MKTSSLVKCVLIGASLPFFAGCIEREVVVRERPRPVVVEQPPPPAPVIVEDYPAAPAPRVEVVTVAPGPDAAWLWAPGCWEWRGRWVWTPGRWARRPHVGAMWVGPHWGVDRYRHRVWVVGTWR